METTDTPTRERYSKVPPILSTDLWEETTKERYYEGLGALPPIFPGRGGFVVGEPVTSRKCAVTGHFEDTYDGFREIAGKFYKTRHEVTIQEFLELVTTYSPKRT